MVDRASWKSALFVRVRIAGSVLTMFEDFLPQTDFADEFAEGRHGFFEISDEPYTLHSSILAHGTVLLVSVHAFSLRYAVSLVRDGITSIVKKLNMWEGVIM